MKTWIVCVGEPLPEEQNKTRLRRMGNLAIALSQNEKNEVEWISSSFDHYQKKQIVSKTTEKKQAKNYRLHMIYNEGYKKNISLARVKFHSNTAKKMFKYMEELEKPDVILASMEPLEIAECAIKYGKQNNIPVIIDVRDLWPEIYYEVFPKYLHWALFPYVKFSQLKLKKIMKSAYSIFGLSESFLKYGLHYANRERLDTDDVIPIAYPNYNYSASESLFEENWKSFGLQKEDFIVLFLGNFGDQFEFNEIIEASIKAYDSHPQIKFVLCGSGKNLDEVKSRIKDNVVFSGWVYQDAILSVLLKAKIGIAPYINSKNYRNNTPNKFGEYLSAGLPILVSVSGDMEKLLNENKCGYKYNTGLDLYDQIIAYYNNPTQLFEHSSNARSLYESMFESTKVYEKMIHKMEYICEENEK